MSTTVPVTMQEMFEQLINDLGRRPRDGFSERRCLITVEDVTTNGNSIHNREFFLELSELRQLHRLTSKVEMESDDE